MRHASVFPTLCIALSACASTLPSAGLEGTSWRLARFESPGDTTAVMRPDDPGRYTLSFGKDGRLAAKLDCNRGTGPWHAVAGDDRSGSLRIGPLATTRAMCPPDAIGARLTRDLDAVSGFRLQDGRLYTTLPADAGSYVWERIAP